MTVTTFPPPGSTAERERAAVLPTTTKAHPGCVICELCVEDARIIAGITGSRGATATRTTVNGDHRGTWHRPTNDLTIQPYPTGGSTP